MNISQYHFFSSCTTTIQNTFCTNNRVFSDQSQFFFLVQPPFFSPKILRKTQNIRFLILNSWKNPFRICWKNHFFFNLLEKKRQKKSPTAPGNSERPRSGAAGSAESALRPGGLCLGARLGDRSGDGDGHRPGGPADATGGVPGEGGKFRANSVGNLEFFGQNMARTWGFLIWVWINTYTYHF